MASWNRPQLAAGTTFLLVLATFAVSATTLPVSGPFCLADCLDYPYAQAVSRFPRDYYWMGLACLLCLLFVVLLACISARAPLRRRIAAILTVTFGAMSSVTLLADYFLQLSVVQPSLMHGEAEGIALLSQFNPHGIFIALEELGYTLMAIAMGCAAATLEGTSVPVRIAKLAFYAALPLSVAALVAISIAYGVDREYRFEVAVISITWLLMLPASAALALVFRDDGARAGADGTR